MNLGELPLTDVWADRQMLLIARCEAVVGSLYSADRAPGPLRGGLNASPVFVQNHSAPPYPAA